MKKREADGSRLRLMLLAAFFLIGAVAGELCVARSDARTGGELSDFLRGYLSLLRENTAPHASWGALIAAYFRECAIAFFSAFTLFAPLLLPAAALWFGFSLSYAVCALTASLGVRGVFVSLALFGLRCALTVPCFLALASNAWGISCGVSAAYLGRGRPADAFLGREWWAQCGVVVLLLSLGVLLDRFLSLVLIRFLLTAGLD